MDKRIDEINKQVTILRISVAILFAINIGESISWLIINLWR